MSRAAGPAWAPRQGRVPNRCYGFRVEVEYAVPWICLCILRIKISTWLEEVMVSRGSLRLKDAQTTSCTHVGISQSLSNLRVHFRGNDQHLASRDDCAERQPQVRCILFIYTLSAMFPQFANVMASDSVCKNLHLPGGANGVGRARHIVHPVAISFTCRV